MFHCRYIPCCCGAGVHAPQLSPEARRKPAPPASQVDNCGGGGGPGASPHQRARGELGAAAVSSPTIYSTVPSVSPSAFKGVISLFFFAPEPGAKPCALTDTFAQEEEEKGGSRRDKKKYFFRPIAKTCFIFLGSC